jgi:hypothetical protein
MECVVKFDGVWIIEYFRRFSEANLVLNDI